MARKKPSEGKPQGNAKSSAPGESPKRRNTRQSKKPGRKVQPQVTASDEPDILLPLLSVEAGMLDDAPDSPLPEMPEPDDEVSAMVSATFADTEQETSEPQAEEHGPGVDMLSFDLGDVRYAFRLDEVEEIVRSRKITRVPGVMPFVLGVTSIRGKVVPVVDIAGIFRDAMKTQPNGTGKIIVLRSARGSVGVIVGKRINIISLPESAFSEPPSHMPEDARRLLEGVALHQRRFVSIIDAGHLLGIPAIRGLHEREA